MAVRVRSAGWLLSARVAGVLISLPMSVLLARVLGAEGKGVLSIVQLVAATAAALFNMGIGAAFIYYAARREASGRDAVRLSVLLSFAITTMLLLVFSVGGERLSTALVGDARMWLVLLGVASVFPVLVAQLLNCFVVGSGSIRAASLINASALAVQLIAYVLLWVFGVLTPATAVVVWVVAVVGATLVWVRLSLQFRVSDVEAGVRALYRRIYRYGLTAWVSGSFTHVALRQDMFLLAYFKSPADVGVYSIAVTMAELSWFIPGSLNVVLMPKVASERDGARDIALRLSRLTWLVTVVVAVAIWLLAIQIVPAVFGKEFTSSILPLGLLIPGVVGYSLASTAAAYVQGMGHPKDWAVAAGVNTVVNLSAGLVLIPRFGVAGAAIASSISYNIMRRVLVSRR